MKFFQNSVLNKHLKAQDSIAIKAAYSRFTARFHDPEVQENIRNSKEEQYQGEFLIDLFFNVLGYIKNPAPNYNITTEHKNVKDSKKADGAILINGVVKAVIELKGTETTDLNRIEAQAFGYKNNQPECVYVITSNFEKLRFYIDNAIENIEFNLFTLTEKEFELLWLCLAYTNIEKNLAKRIKDESVSQEDVITKNLYNDYSLFKRELHQNLVALNPDHDPLTLFKKSQKLLDRFLFLFFAEDRQLLPPNSVRLILDDWRDLQDRDVEVALYSRFKKYFEYLNTGFKGKRYDVFAYNGGLFKTDELLNGLKIEDELLYWHAMKLSTYDFVSEVDVNILGHIFENSLNELDEIKAQLAGQQVDKAKSKRKKDGVFYTPKYITKYIVDNTVGKLCIEKKAEIGLIEEEYITDRKRTNKTKQPLFDKLNTYRNWLLQLTICDPACGSGAFLNQALDFLINEHRYIDELQAKLFGDAMVLSDFEKNILENNLFGVDLNEESVEIAKLSLWLRTAQPNRKLNDLNNNIKCGNSLIDDPAVAGDKAFNWHNEFPTVFAKGGFDVVIGNPPYGAELSNKDKDQLITKYSCFKGNYDIYSAFIQLAFRLNRENGFWGFINPVSWQSGETYFSLRQYLVQNGILEIGIKLPYDVFADAYVDTGIYIIRNSKSDSYLTSVFEFPVKSRFYGDINAEIQMKKLPSEYWLKLDSLKIVLNPAFYELLPKVFDQTIPLATITNSIRGILPNDDDVHKTKMQDDKLFFVGGLYRYTYSKDFEGVNYGEHLKEKPRDYSYFQGERILIRRLINRQFRVMAAFANDEFVNKKDLYNLKTEDHNFDLKYLLAIINSKLISFLKIKGSTNATKDDFGQLTLSDIRQIPIKPITIIAQQPFKEMVNILMLKIEEFQFVQHQLSELIKAKFDIPKLTTKLQIWHELDFREFLNELKKAKVQLSLSSEVEWMHYFNEQKQTALELKSEIDKTDKEIDRMVYELYGLSEEEIGIVEGV
ncbi:MAG: N-6 DNA methylase [Bacteroidota bacterium]